MSILTPDELAALGEEHAYASDDGTTCLACGHEPPCPTLRLVLALTDEVARRLHAEMQVRALAGMVGTYRPERWADLDLAARQRWLARAVATLRGVAPVPAPDPPDNVIRFPVERARQPGQPRRPTPA